MSSKKILKVKSLSKRFTNVQAVKDVSFTIEEGDVFAFLGPNGAGKTTTLRILLDIIKSDSGSIEWTINGESTSLPQPSQIGYLPEERGLYLDLPILRTLVYLASIRGMHPSTAKSAAMEWLERLGLEKRAYEKLQTLSKGNQQKVQFIASILHKPAFAILDEPFSGLDPINQEQFIGYIQELNQQGSTILLSSHQMPLVEKIANKVFLINDGQEVYNGPLRNIYNNSGTQHTFDITFEGVAPIDIWKEMKGVENATLNGDNRLHITFGPGLGINQIMGMLSDVENISHIKSQNSNLHDIFLSLARKKELIS
jgi:ABC-2 type transport system ATP-binding protein